ncbi:sulfotransferase [Candidatus Nitronereus thalassa]|uniref:Sulfotransferase n=1 Tax=Candidatus Nitronereus thalassa TaxID=3020898 RepID=A0ABU3KBX7_9BACT|nr:sulfotransferase [Candidatus Nitronereus thalassa]MDT7043927.1 sulfotransferase [Candidatus Nitronereus thalassa]
MNILPFVQLFNAAGARLRDLGLPLVPFDSKSFMAQASKKTKLQDFGDSSFLEPLNILLEACEKEARLSMVGRLAVKGETIRLLGNRLILTQDRKTYPEISQEPITSPIFIVGLPRTGSTFLHNLLAQDPGLRAPRMWETMFPSPPPGHPDSQTESPIRQTDQLLKGFYLVAPKFKIVHPMTAQDPTECVTIMSHSFMSAQFQSTYHIPSYQKWLESGNLRPTYVDHRQFLQQLQWGSQPRQWILKAPAHILSLESLLAVYPDAKIVQTHRSPHAVLGSVSSLDVILRQAFSRSVDPQAIGQEALTQWANAVQRAMNVRDAVSTQRHQFYDVLYNALEQHPIRTIEQMYQHFGLTLTNTAKSNMQNYLLRHPNHKNGTHRYTLSQFGLTQETIFSHFKPYILRYNLDT